MTKRIQEYPMDIWAGAIAGEELPDGFVYGPKTGLIIPAPTPAPTLSRHERINRAKPALAWIGGVLLVAGVGLLIVAFAEGWLA